MQYDLQVSLNFFFVFSETKQRVVTNIHMQNHKSKATKMVESERERESTFGFARAEKLEREMRRWRWNPREGAGMEREWGGSGRVRNGPRGRENEGALKSARERVRERSRNWKRRRGSHRHLIGHQTQHKVSEVVVVVAVGRMNERQREKTNGVRCSGAIWIWLICMTRNWKKKKYRERERESGGALFYFLFGFLWSGEGDCLS